MFTFQHILSSLCYPDNHGEVTARQWMGLGAASHETLNSTGRTVLIPEAPVTHQS